MPISVSEYRQRAADPVIGRLLGQSPVVLLEGPRSTGKVEAAARHAATIVRLDRAEEAAPFGLDAAAPLEGMKEPILLAEWHQVPQVLDAVRRAVEADPRPGRFLLTGSVRADLNARTFPGPGRISRVQMFGLTVAELRGRPTLEPFVDRLIRGADLTVPNDAPDLRGYVELALESGFPHAALSLTGWARGRWIDAYVDQLLARNAPDGSTSADPGVLRRYAEAFARASASVLEGPPLFERVGVHRKDALAAEQLLTHQLIVDAVPAFTSNRIKGLGRAAKHFLTDAAVLAGVLRADANAILRDGELLGRLLDTFVAAQLRAELALVPDRPTLSHLREGQGRRQIDLIVELPGSRVIAVEVKATAAPKKDAGRHLGWLRDQLGERFVRGVVLHTGPKTWELEERVLAAPIAALWT